MKPLLIGMNNPLGPDYPLFPAPVGCTGYRLWKMLEGETGATRSEYLGAFERTNLVEGREWNMRRARENVPAMLERMRGRHAVIVGSATYSAFGSALHPYSRHFLWRDSDDLLCPFRYALFPHPSGRNRYYNDPATVVIASQFIGELYLRSQRQ